MRAIRDRGSARFAVVASCLIVASASAQSRDRRAPDGYAHVVGRIGGSTAWLFSNLRYESNNRAMRGAFDPRPESGCDNARRQRELAARTRGLFVLRDALYSQQDHPIEHRACAVMLPANWVTAAVADTIAGTPLSPVRAPSPEDDAAWAALGSPQRMFGSFPPSQNLFDGARLPRAEATDAEARARIDNARHNVRALAAEAQHLIDAAPRGPQGVADAGAERIAASDRAYFTPAIRHDHVIVLGVENPNEHELRDENKGIAIWGREVPAAALTMVRDAIYRRRLLDGEIAIERYDITQAADRRRAVDVLEALVPEGSRGHRVWLWVGGGLVEGTERVEDASEMLPTLRRELDAAAIATDRVVVYNRPSFRLRGHSRADFAAQVDRFRRLGLPLSVNAGPGALARVFGPADRR